MSSHEQDQAKTLCTLWRHYPRTLRNTTYCWSGFRVLATLLLTLLGWLLLVPR